MNDTPDITRFLERASQGDEQARDQLFNLLKGELRTLAGRAMRKEHQGHTLQPTALVNEAYVRLMGGKKLELTSRGHFMAYAARAMRSILIDHARAKMTARRGGDFVRVSLAGVEREEEQNVDLLALSELMERLAQIKPRHSQILELRFFAGLTLDEIGEILGISATMVAREQKMATAWLRARME